MMPPNTSGVMHCLPSDHARSGSVCTSTISPSTPAATAALLIDSIRSRRPVPWLPILMAVVAASAAAVYFAVKAGKPSLPPEKEQVRALTNKLMKLLAEKEYGLMKEAREEGGE